MAEYCGISLLDVETLDILDYLIYRRDAFIHNLNQTAEGREYLTNAYRLTVTDFDVSAMRDFSKTT